jgi:hypothetical protein
MTDPEERFFERALERMRKAMLVLGVGGALAALAWRGWTWGAGFALGSVASWLNFRWLRQIVDGLAGKPTRKRVMAMAGLRYLILGGGAYVILRFSRISLHAFLAGLFISAAAVVVEIIYQLTYART